MQRQAYKCCDSAQLPACACMHFEPWYCICQVQQVEHYMHLQQWACMKPPRHSTKPHGRSNKCLHMCCSPQLNSSCLSCSVTSPVPVQVLQGQNTVQEFRSIPLPPAGCCQKRCGGKGAVQRSQADTGALGCGGRGPLGAQTSLADRQAPAQPMWETLIFAQAALGSHFQVLNLSMLWCPIKFRLTAPAHAGLSFTRFEVHMHSLAAAWSGSTPSASFPACRLPCKALPAEACGLSAGLPPQCGT